MRMLKSPAHGYGGHFNPCIDCKILMISEAIKYMEDVGAKFIVTGEVVGQRPMSQRKDAMRIIERDSGAEGILLRPLCAKLLKPTIPEIEGWVKRESLFDLSGRSRKPQIDMAEKLGVTDYPSPAGGCCLTDPIISKRIKKLYEIKASPDPHDIELLRIGRPFHIGDGVIMTLGRNLEENGVIEKIGIPGDIYIKLLDLPGPTGIVRGVLSDKKIALAMSILARYSKARGEDEVRVGLGKSPHSFDTVIGVRPSDDDKIRDLRL
jgi:tRNA-specific 2-thiouridylase